MHTPQRRTVPVSPYSIGHVVLTALQAARDWANDAVRLVGDSLFFGASGVENGGVSPLHFADAHESGAVPGRQARDNTVGGQQLCHRLTFGVGGVESGGGTLKEE